MKFLVLVFSLFWFGLSDASAKEVTVGMGNFEPYFIEEGDTGIFADLITAVFRYMPDHHPKYIYDLPNRRLWRELEDGNIDALSNLFDSKEMDVCRSDQIFRFHNVAVTKASAKIKISNISDLAGNNIVTFQGAKHVFGNRFANLTNFQSYTEVYADKLQVKMLIYDRADVSVGDKFIFLHELKKIRKSLLEPIELVFHDIFPLYFARMGFYDKEICELFNKGLKQVRQTGEFESIYDTYLKSLIR